MEKEQPNYYTVISADVRYDKNLSLLEKLLYAEIIALTNKEGYCWASNQYFARLFDKNDKYISSKINHLAKLGYLKMNIDRAGGNSRKIWIPIQKNLNTYSEKPEYPYSEKPEHNNTRYNNTNNITSNISENKFSQEIVDVMELFSQINPSIQYGNKTQRKACEDMLKRFGYENTIKMVKQVLGVQGNKYAPTATTPYTMYQKLADFKIYFDKQKTNDIVLDLTKEL
jgi:hypothetical protein